MVHGGRIAEQVGAVADYGHDTARPRSSAGAEPTLLHRAGPTDLPVERATKFQTIVNLKTAKALGLDVPTATFLRADAVIV
jgi:putative ABC transport system substrate-binding protein